MSLESKLIKRLEDWQSQKSKLINEEEFKIETSERKIEKLQDEIMLIQSKLEVLKSE